MISDYGKNYIYIIYLFQLYQKGLDRNVQLHLHRMERNIPHFISQKILIIVLNRHRQRHFYDGDTLLESKSLLIIPVFVNSTINKRNKNHTNINSL